MENGGIKKERAETTDGSGDENIDNKTHSRRVFIELLAPNKKKTTLLMARIQLYTDHNTTSGNHESMGRVELNSPQFPGGESQMSFNVYKGRLSGSEACLAELHNSASSNGFFKDYYNGSKMVPWYSKRIRMLTAFLILFIALCLVMTGLFVWRVLYYDTKEDGVSEVTPGITELPVVAPRPDTCPVRAKAVPLTIIPKNIKDTLSEIERELETKINNDTVSILANVVYMDQVIWQRSFGKMNRSNPQAPELSSRTVFPIASVSKVFTALMLYKMYHDKHVKTLDDSFKTYVPTFSIKDPFNSHDITLREIVSHMSGLPRESPCFPEADGTIVCPGNNSIMLERIRNLSLIVQPGTKVSYSNLGFGLLGQGLAFSQNASFEEWMKNNIFDPLEMYDSGFQLTREIRQKIPVGYLRKHPLEPVDWGWASPAGGMFTSIEDIAKVQ